MLRVQVAGHTIDVPDKAQARNKSPNVNEFVADELTHRGVFEENPLDMTVEQIKSTFTAASDPKVLDALLTVETRQTAVEHLRSIHPALASDEDEGGDEEPTDEEE